MERLKIVVTNQYKKDFIKIKKQGLNIEKLKKVILDLSENKKLDPIYKDHSLLGKYKGLRECHIEPDWLLIYRIDNNTLELILTRTGSHANLFK